MVVLRTSPRWVTGLMKSSTRGVRDVTRAPSWQNIQRRGYPASQGHASHKASGDLPWAIGAAVVTIPSVAYLLQSRPKREHGHGHDEGDHDEHEAGHEGVEKAEGEEDHEEKPEGGAQGDVNEGGDTDSPSEDGSTGSEPDKPTRPDHSVEDAGQGTPETPRRDPHEGAHEVQSGGNVEGVRFKGATSGGDTVGEGGQPIQRDVRKHIPDAKGGAKKRISSNYGKPQGGPVEGDEEWPNRRFSAYTPSDKDDASKQEGISNTDTKHSYDLSMDPDKSKKGEGFVDTAKVKGPVDPSRPQAENRPRRDNATGSQADT